VSTPTGPAHRAATEDGLPQTIRIGTRASTLARTQAAAVADAMTQELAAGRTVELVPMTSSGDQTTASLASLGGTGVFAAALRVALLEGECDVVVHSLKDLPTTAHPGLVVAATPQRADARDALCARDGLTLAELPPGAAIGTGSPRRAAQALTLRPDLQVIDIRGNVQTRLAKVTDGELDAVILAAAGLQRIGYHHVITELLDVQTWPTAPGQGALAVEIHEDDAPAYATLLSAINDPATAAATTAERQVLATLEAGCAAPLGARAAVDGDTLTVAGTAYRPGGGDQISAFATGPAQEALTLGARVAEDLLDGGADQWLERQ